MEPAAGIGKLGFSRWYERELIEGHAWLITCFLCMLAIAACVESMSFRGPPGGGAGVCRGGGGGLR